MNLLLIIAAVILVCSVINGYKKGMVKSIISFVSLIILCIVVALLANGLNSYLDGEFLNVVIMVLLLAVLGIVHHLLGVVFFSAKLIAKLPIISSVDKLLGIVVGALQTVLVLWTVYMLTMLLDLGTIGELIKDYTRNSEILTWFYENNYLAHFVEQLGAKFTAL